MILINTERPRFKKAIITVWRLTIEFHTVEGSDIGRGNKYFLIEQIRLDWEKKVNSKLLAKGWSKIGIESVVSEEEVHNVAFKILNKPKNIEEYYK